MMNIKHIHSLLMVVALIFSQVAYSFCEGSVPAQNPDEVYRVHDNGTATDLRTGLMWKRCSEGQDWTGSTCAGTPMRAQWAGTLSHAEQSNYGGHNDWRIPNVKELGSLVEECRSNPAINTNIFPNTPLTPNPAFWTSSPNAGSESSSWFMGFDLGYTLSSMRNLPGTAGALMRLVRDAD